MVPALFLCLSLTAALAGIPGPQKADHQDDSAGKENERQQVNDKNQKFHRCNTSFPLDCGLPAVPGSPPSDAGGKQKRCAGKPAQHKNMFHHTKNDSMNKYGKGTLANQGEMSYNIPCGYGLGAVV